MSAYHCDICQRERDTDYSQSHDLTGLMISPSINVMIVCNYCFTNRLVKCSNCSKYGTQFDLNTSRTGKLCDSCVALLDYKYCSECNLYVPSSDMYIDNLCSQCYSNNYTHCRHCDSVMRRTRHTVDGHVTYNICNVCLHSQYSACRVCNEVISISELHTIQSHRVCNNCIPSLAYCDSCHTSVINRSYCYDGLRRCDTCIHSANLVYCDDCGFYVEYNHHHLGIRSYSYKPNPIFIGKSNDLMFYGYELECECDSKRSSKKPRQISTELLQKFSENESLFYIKTDGSLSDGLEIVSHPHTITKLIKSQWVSDVCDYLVNDHYKSHDTVTCGLHIHMSKQAFLDGIHETKFSYFIYESKHTRLVARRDFNSYCHKINKHLSYISPDNHSSSRYEGVNFTNQHTVEVRVFKGTLKVNTLHVCFLYCDAVFNFTKTARLNVLTGSERDNEFIKFIQYKPKYAKLLYYLTHNGTNESNT